MKVIKLNDTLILIILCLFCSLGKIIFSAVYANPGLQTPQDLFSTLYTSAYFAGRDWTDIGREYSAYYGYGFFSLFSWLYKICNDGLLIYRIILVCCHLLTVISCVVAWKIMGMFALNCSNYAKYAICIGCVFTQGNMVCGVVNEYMLNTMTWLILYVILLLANEVEQGNNNNIKKYTLLLGILMIYSCTVHARAVIFYPLIIICVCLVYLLYKKLIVNIPIMLGCFMLFFPYKLFTNYLQTELLGEINGNSSVIAKVSNGMAKGMQIEQIWSYILSIIAYVHETAVITGGIAIVGLLGIIFIVLKHKLKKICIKLFCLGLYSLCGIGALLLGICFSCRGEIYRGMYFQISEHLRFITLVRYFMPFVAPFMMFSILHLIISEKDEVVKMFRWSIGGIIIIQTLFFFLVYPKINYTGWGNAVYLTYTWDKEMYKNEVYLVGGVMVLFLISTVSMILIYKRKWMLLGIALFLHSVVGITYCEWHQYTKVNLLTLVNAGYEYLVDDNEINDVYVVVDTEINGEEREKIQITDYYFLYQVLLPSKHIIPNDVPEGVGSAVVLTDNPECVNNYDSYEVIQLDDNEWMLKK